MFQILLVRYGVIFLYLTCHRIVLIVPSNALSSVKRIINKLADKRRSVREHKLHRRFWGTLTNNWNVKCFLTPSYCIEQ